MPSLAFCALFKCGGHLHRYAHAQITLAIALQIFYAAPLQPAAPSAGCRRGNLDGCPAFQRGHFDFGPERRLHKTHGNFADQVIAVARKNFVVFHAEKNIQVTRRPAAETRFAISTGAQPCAAFHTCRDAQLDLGRALAFALAVAGFARFFQQAALALCNADTSARC